jgi:hypothetical protein
MLRGRGPSGVSSRTYLLEVFVASWAGLLLEIAYTRIISYKLFYFYTYFVIGLALLGLGAGGVLVAISKRLKEASSERIVFGCLVAGAAAAGVGFLVVAALRVNSYSLWLYTGSSLTNGVILLVLCAVLFLTFVPTGILLSTVFARQTGRIGRLYAADLVGAGIAAAVVVPLLARFGPPTTVMLAGFAMALAAARTAIGSGRRATVVMGGLAAVLALGAIVPSVLPDVALDDGKVWHGVGTTDVVYSKWSPVFRVDVRDIVGNQRLLFHDGLAGSVMLKWDGKRSSLGSFGFDDDVRALPFAGLGRAPKQELIIGAAAGHEIVASLYFGARHVDAAELNPVTYDLVTDVMADYNGHLAEKRGVHYVKADGRSYLAQSDKAYDLIWFPAPDSYAATNASTASAFVLSESYLYTKEAIADALNHLSKGGIVAAQFGEFDLVGHPNRTLRYISTAIAALRSIGIQDVSQRILVSAAQPYALPGESTILIKKEPFTRAEIERFTAALPRAGKSSLFYAPGVPVSRTLVSAAVANPDAPRPAYYPFSVGPIADNQPFFWHFAPFNWVLSNLTQPLSNINVELAIGERVLFALLAVAILLSFAFLLLPFITIRSTWTKLPRKTASALYFASLGFGFIFIEITLIQRLVLFLGYPTYSLTVTLASLLVSVGIGAWLSTYVRQSRATIAGLAVAITALIAYYTFGLAATTDALFGLPLIARAFVGVVLLAPLGICLGMFMPVGLRAISALSDHSTEYVAWSWAVNGFASVVGSVLATILAMTYGFRVVLLIALVLYWCAAGALRSLSRQLT